MTDAIDDLITRVLVREGGYSDNPADAGGATKYGITIGALRDWRRVPVGKDDVANLTESEARQIYRSNYFIRTGFDQVQDPELREFLFDFGINSGVGRASMALQAALGVKADGAIGPITLAALRADTNPKALFWRTKCERYEMLLRYIGADPRQATFATGWANRLDQFSE